MNEQEIQALKSLLSTPKKVVIVPHKNPDGDAIGSSLGLYHYLKNNHHKVNVIAPNDYPEFLKWMPGNDTVMIYENKADQANKLIEDAEIIFTLDFNALHRTGDMEVPLEKSSAIKVLIDHHQQPDDYAQFIYSDVFMCSTCEMIYHFLEMLNDTEAINSDIANCLYAGIMTDTGSFRFPSTTSTTHCVVASLIDQGASNTEIHNQVYDSNSYNRLQLLGRALSNLKTVPEFRTAYITLTQKDLNQFDYKKGDTEGIVNYALSIKNTVFAVIFIEQEREGIVKMSLRSKGSFDVNTFAREHFNGGGHINAAGGRSELSLNDTIEKFIAILPNYKNDLKS